MTLQVDCVGPGGKPKLLVFSCIGSFLFQNLFGALTAMASSSGYSLGSCNWVIHSEYEKVHILNGIILFCGNFSEECKNA